jgi:hypothetical protein
VGEYLGATREIQNELVEVVLLLLRIFDLLAGWGIREKGAGFSRRNLAESHAGKPGR